MKYVDLFRVKNSNTRTTGRSRQHNNPFTLIELLVNAACKTGVLYNRCGMLSLWGGALKTDKNGQKRISVRRRIRLVSPNNKIPRFSLKVKGGLGESENLLFS